MRALITLAISMLLTAVAYGQSVTDCYNGFGIYLEPSPASPTNYTEYLGPPGMITAYIVLLNPYNENTGQPITSLGGYEFNLLVPDHLQVNYTLHGGATNYMIAPKFFVGFSDAGHPVGGNQALLVTMEIGATSDEAAFWYITFHYPCGINPICPEEVFVTDWDDNWTISRGTPTSWSFEAPVFCMFAACDDAPGEFPPGGTGGVWGDCWVVPAARASWGDIKAMYR